ncbi:hypothetical protein [Pseudoalteromonas sp. R3]|uniref:hypothetical protein n=1 Tax=Pseudoalteromonas sp. R3 TaxID=1709477 RepID=UPI0006B5EE9A|nr:hypothetical protein [Pseudoalteromonas sp. R3]AZZ98750.1 hypothetical protein ELR70_17590 [Pseudoalteromonas sp. R3]
MIELGGQQYGHFVWTDEHNYRSVAEQYERALNGAPHIEKTAIPFGRPITLQSDMEAAEAYKALLSHSQSALDSFAISVRGVLYQVVWDHTQQPVSGEPVSVYCDAEPDFYKNVILKFKTVG